MRSLSKVTSLILLLSLCLCFLSTPALAEHGWTEDPPRKGGGPSGADGEDVPQNQWQRTDGLLDNTNFLYDISIRIAMMIEPACGTSVVTANPPQHQVSYYLLEVDGNDRCQDGVR